MLNINQPTLLRLTADLRSALPRLTWREWARLFLTAATGAGVATYEHKKGMVRRAWAAGGRKLRQYRDGGFVSTTAADFHDVKEFVRSLPSRFRDGYQKFQALPLSRQVEETAVWVLTAMLAYAVAGGEDLEGGLPDTDIALAGIGAHRHFLSHSILLGFGMEFALRFAAGAIVEVHHRLPPGHHPVWDGIVGIIDRHQGKAIGAVWVGIGAHLLKDASLFASATKPVSGLPFSMPMEAHQAFFAANAVAAGAVGVDQLRDGKPQRYGAPIRYGRPVRYGDPIF